MNVFSSEPFLRALADTYFPGRPAEIAAHAVEGHVFQLLRIGGKAVTSPPMVDYWEPVAGRPGGAGDPVYALRSLPRAALTSAAYTGELLRTGGLSVAPFVDLRGFDAWDDLQRFAHARNKRVARDSDRQVRRLERDIGAIVFTADDHDGQVIDRCIAWRSTRFRSAARMHRDPRHAVFLRTLRDEGVARVSSLRAGEQLVAAVVGLPHEGRYSYWITAYNNELGRYSPGRLLLESLLRASVADGDHEFDLLIGSERYKWVYATDARLVGPLGPQPVLPGAVAAARRRLRLGRKYLRLRKALGL